MDPNFAKANYNLGNLLLAQGDTEAAISRYSKAVRINPLFVEAYNGLGLAFMQTGELEQAVICFRKSVKLNPAFSDGLRNLKLAESISERIFQAVSGMRDALNFTVQTANLDDKVIELLEKKEKLEKALKYFQKTLSLQPGFTEFDQNNIAAVLAVKQKYEQKLDLFQRISEILAHNAEVAYHIACIYSRRAQVQQSMAWLNSAIENGFNRWELIKLDSDLDSIRKDENFQLGVKG
jgi:tetratricopeptide (TPR) repeat protein